jgi:catechol 2,3-dioxygenase-like lactoylglutathione lyase family enzyme
MNLNQITIQSADVNLSVQFYLQLGLELIVDSRPSYVRFACPQGSSTFSVSHQEQIKVDSTTLYFEVSDVDKTCQMLKEKGIIFEKEPEDQRWLWRESELIDPDGHHLKIYTAGTNRKNPPWRVNTLTRHVPTWFHYFAESPVNLMK